MDYLSIGNYTRRTENDGLIFDIQKFSVHDGPGIRTLVFLKGCPLRCEWCANPEGQRVVPQVMWDIKTCRRCQKCNGICPGNAIQESAEGKVIDRVKCFSCGACDSICSSHSIKLTGRYVSVDEVMAEVDKDRMFYETSGGGLTLGGGEPLAQPEFAAGLLNAAKQRGYNTAIETSGYAAWESILSVIAITDLFLYDIKSMDDTVHRKYTGVSNRRIIENAKRIADTGTPILIRTPLIPGVNDSDENIRQTAAFAGTIRAKGIELLPYHNLGETKYNRLGRIYDMASLRRQSKETVSSMKVMAKEEYQKNYL